MKFTFVQVLLLSSASANNYLDLQDDLTEDLTVKMSEYDMDRLDHYYDRKYRRAQRDMDDMIRRMQRDGPHMEEIELDAAADAAMKAAADAKKAMDYAAMAKKKAYDDAHGHRKMRCIIEPMKGKHTLCRSVCSDYKTHYSPWRPCDSFKMDHDFEPRPQRSGPGALVKYLSGVTKDEFGWTLEEKYKQI